MAARSKQQNAASGSGEQTSFESALEQLERIVDRLEQGELELEAAMEAFEEGVRLSKDCASRLDAAEQRISVLSEEGGEWLSRPFEPRDSESDSDDEQENGG